MPLENSAALKKRFLCSTYLFLILAETTVTFKAILALQLFLSFTGGHQQFNIADGELCAADTETKLVCFTEILHVAKVTFFDTTFSYRKKRQLLQI